MHTRLTTKPQYVLITCFTGSGPSPSLGKNCNIVVIPSMSAGENTCFAYPSRSRLLKRTGNVALWGEWPSPRSACPAFTIWSARGVSGPQKYASGHNAGPLHTKSPMIDPFCNMFREEAVLSTEWTMSENRNYAVLQLYGN